MTTINKDITNFLEEQGITRGPSASGTVLSSYNPIRILNLLGKLNHEDLEDLLNAMQDLYEAAEEPSCGHGYKEYSEEDIEDAREEGEAEGKLLGYEKGYDAGYTDGHSDGYAEGLDEVKVGD